MIKNSRYNRSYIIKSKYNFTNNGGTIGTYGLGAIVPQGAIVKNVFYKVNTTFQTAGADAGTIAIQLEAANDIVAALAVSNAANIWDQGLHSTKIPFGAVASALADGAYALDPEGGIINDVGKLKERGTPPYIVTTQDRELSVVVATQNVTAGDMDIYLEYVI